MKKLVECECGNTEFWYFWNKVRCPKCQNEYKLKETLTYKTEHAEVYDIEKWVRKINNETHEYGNWAKVK